MGRFWCEQKSSFLWENRPGAQLGHVLAAGVCFQSSPKLIGWPLRHHRHHRGMRVCSVSASSQAFTHSPPACPYCPTTLGLCAYALACDVSICWRVFTWMAWFLLSCFQNPRVPSLRPSSGAWFANPASRSAACLHPLRRLTPSRGF